MRAHRTLGIAVFMKITDGRGTDRLTQSVMRLRCKLTVHICTHNAIMDPGQFLQGT